MSPQMTWTTQMHAEKQCKPRISAIRVQVLPEKRLGFRK